jgi:hypothetical protein
VGHRFVAGVRTSCFRISRKDLSEKNGSYVLATSLRFTLTFFHYQIAPRSSDLLDTQLLRYNRRRYASRVIARSRSFRLWTGALAKRFVLRVRFPTVARRKPGQGNTAGPVHPCSPLARSFAPRRTSLRRITTASLAQARITRVSSRDLSTACTIRQLPATGRS